VRGIYAESLQGVTEKNLGFFEGVFGALLYGKAFKGGWVILNMKKEKLSAKDKDLIQLGKQTAIRGFIDDRENSVGCDLAGALITNSGKIFTGINMDVKSSSGASTCGERSAILHMLSQGEKEINTMVAVWISRDYKKNGEWGILPPCGICRHVMNQFGNPWVIISKTEKVKLRDLFPLGEKFR